MLDKYRKVAYEYLRPEQVKAIREKCSIAYIPAGSLEWHSFQNPLGTDSLKAHAICCEAALKYGGIVLPPFYQGMLGVDNWGPKDWSGFTLSFNEDAMFSQAIAGIARALVFGKWKVIVGVTGHDIEPQRDAMHNAIKSVVDGKTADGFALREGDLHRRNKDLPFHMDHAGAWETSCMMYACPGTVDLARLRARGKSTIEAEKFEMSGPEAIGGKNPLKYASKKLGKKIVETMGDLIGKKAVETLNNIG